MAFPVVEEITGTTDTSNGTAVVVNYPATVNAGDLLILGMIVDQNTTFTEDGTDTFELTSGADGSPPARYAIFRKVADGSEGGGTVSFTAVSSVEATAQMYRIRVGTWEGTLAGGFAIAASASNTDDPPNLNPGWGALDILWIIYGFSSNYLMGSPSFAAPANYGNFAARENNESGAGLPGQCTARRELNASSENPAAWGGDVNPNWGITIAVRPAADVGQPFDLINGLYVPRINGIVNPFVR